MRGKQRSCLFQPFIPAARRLGANNAQVSVRPDFFFVPPLHLGLTLWSRVLSQGPAAPPLWEICLFHRNIPKDVASLNIQFPVDIFHSRRSFFFFREARHSVRVTSRPASPADGPTFSTTSPGRSISPVALFIHWKSPLNSWRGDSCISQGQAQINVNSDLHPS